MAFAKTIQGQEPQRILETTTLAITENLRDDRLRESERPDVGLTDNAQSQRTACSDTDETARCDLPSVERLPQSLGGFELQDLCRERRHLAHRVFQRERLLVAHVFAQHPDIGAVAARMRLARLLQIERAAVRRRLTWRVTTGDEGLGSVQRQTDVLWN